MSGRTRGNVLALVMAVFTGVLMFTTGWLMRPVYPDPPYLVEWEPTGRGYVEYPGEVLNGGLAAVRLQHGPTPQATVAAELLRRGAPLGVWAVAGPQTAGLSPLIVLYDTKGAEVALLGVDGADVVYRERTRARSWGLNDPLIRAPGVLDSIAPGDSVRLASGAARLGRCFDIATIRYCGLGLTGGSGWALLADPGSISIRTKSILDGVFLAILAIPIGVFATPGVALLLALSLAWYGMFRLPVDTVLMPVPVLSLAIMLLGIVTGLLAAGRRRRPPAERTAGTAEHAEPAALDEPPGF